MWTSLTVYMGSFIIFILMHVALSLSTHCICIKLIWMSGGRVIVRERVFLWLLGEFPIELEEVKYISKRHRSAVWSICFYKCCEQNVYALITPLHSGLHSTESRSLSLSLSNSLKHSVLKDFCTTLLSAAFFLCYQSGAFQHSGKSVFFIHWSIWKFWVISALVIHPNSN